MDRRALERDQLERDLRAAIGANRIRPAFQPVVDLRSNEIVGFEAVPKWIDGVSPEIAPDRFIPVAEENGLIHELFERVLKESCAVAANWPQHVTLALDVYPSLLKDTSLSSMIVKTLEESGVVPARLELEITESALVRDLEGAQQILGSLQESGVRIVLDNFGTGYSSLYHLRHFRPDKIKIDRSFIDTLGSHESAKIVSALVGLGHGLGLSRRWCRYLDPTTFLVNYRLRAGPRCPIQ